MISFFSLMLESRDCVVFMPNYVCVVIIFRMALGVPPVSHDQFKLTHLLQVRNVWSSNRFGTALRPKGLCRLVAERLCYWSLHLADKRGLQSRENLVLAEDLVLWSASLGQS